MLDHGSTDRRHYVQNVACNGGGGEGGDDGDRPAVALVSDMGPAAPSPAPSPCGAGLFGPRRVPAAFR